MVSFTHDITAGMPLTLRLYYSVALLLRKHSHFSTDVIALLFLNMQHVLCVHTAYGSNQTHATCKTKTTQVSCNTTVFFFLTLCVCIRVCAVLIALIKAAAYWNHVLACPLVVVSCMLLNTLLFQASGKLNTY